MANPLGDDTDIFTPRRNGGLRPLRRNLGLEGRKIILPALEVPHAFVYFKVCVTGESFTSTLGFKVVALEVGLCHVSIVRMSVDENDLGHNQTSRLQQIIWLTRWHTVVP